MMDTNLIPVDKGGNARPFASGVPEASSTSIQSKGGFIVAPASAHALTRSDFGSYIGFSDALAAKRSPAISIS